MTLTGSRRQIAALLVALLVVAQTPARPVAAETPTTADLFAFDSIEYIGQWERVVRTDADAVIDFPIGANTASRVEVFLSGLDGERWRIVLQAGQGDTLHVGHYPNAGLDVVEAPDINLTGEGRGCGEPIRGAFTIHELTTDEAGIPTGIAASFEHWCGESPGPFIGRVRVNSDYPIAALSLPRTSRVFEFVTVGEQSETRTYTLEAIGDLPVTVSSVTVTGPQAGDFPIDDACAGVTLDLGETCTFDVKFVPGAIEDRRANIVIGHDGPLAPLTLPLLGVGRIPTATTVRVEPDWTYFRPGIAMIATVTPNPGHNNVECWLDGEHIATGTIRADGTVLCFAPRDLGNHTFQARYQGSGTYGDSWSATLAFEASQTTSVTLDGPASAAAETPIDLTAAVSTASDLLYPGGTLTVRDLSTGTLLGSLGVDGPSMSMTVTVGLAPGGHEIEASYSGVSGILDGSSHAMTIHVQPPPTPVPPPPTPVPPPPTPVPPPPTPVPPPPTPVPPPPTPVPPPPTSVPPPPDTVPPTATAPLQSMSTGSALSSGRAPVRLSWSGSDVASGIARYEIRRQVDRAAWTVDASNVASTSIWRLLQPGHTYRYAIRAVDKAGNVSPWAYGATFRVTAYSEAHGAIRYSGTWSNASGARYGGGKAKAASAAGSRATFRVTGRSAAWIALKGPTRGKATVFVNGVVVVTVDLYSPTWQAQRVVWAANWSASATRTIVVRVRGTPGRSRVDIDGFIALQ
jgi:hypothetical protein